MGDKYIASLDVGTTTIRSFIFNSNAKIIGSACDQVELIYPQPGHVEIEPEKLWQTIVNVIKNAIKDSGLSPSQITCLGISTQRSTFITWDKQTGRYFHNFITWKDLRADELVRKWNHSITMKSIRAASHCLYMITRSKRFLAGSVLRLMNTQATLRLCWLLQHNANLREAVNQKRVLFGTVDTWVLHKLTSGRLHVSDVSCASATGMYDPFTMKWAGWAGTVFGLPLDILPEVVDTTKEFGCVDERLFGAAIPITCSVSDQSASMIGSQCFRPGDIKVTLGTGSFLNVNTGRSAHASIMGLYPLVAWKIDDEIVYAVEGASNETGSLIKFAISIGLIKDPNDSSDLARSVASSDGVYFIPAFSGLGPQEYYLSKQAPVNDHQAASGFLGIRPTTTKSHMMRSILESIVFRVAQLYQCTQKETDFKFRTIRVDGGVSRNNFVCQLLSDLTSLEIERSQADMSAVGAAYFAGLQAGVWKSKEDLRRFMTLEQIFRPSLKSHADNAEVMSIWARAVDRFRGWYEPQEVAVLAAKTMTYQHCGEGDTKLSY